MVGEGESGERVGTVRWVRIEAIMVRGGFGRRIGERLGRESLGLVGASVEDGTNGTCGTFRTEDEGQKTEDRWKGR